MSRASDKARRVRCRSFRLKLERFTTDLGLAALPAEPTRALMRRVAWEAQPYAVKAKVAALHAEMEQALLDLSPATASGDGLQRLADLFGIARREPAAPEGVEA